MLAHISSHRLTRFIEVTFRAPSGTDSQHVTVRGIHLWMSPENVLEYVLLSPEEEGFEFVGKIVLGSSFESVVRQVNETLLESDEAQFDVEIDESVIAQHQQLNVKSSELATSSNQLAQSGSIDIEFLLKAADGVPVEVVIAGTPLGLRTAVVSLPEVSGVQRVNDAGNVQVVWDPKSSELKVRLPGIAEGEKRLWVRIALGESGDLLAVDRARVQADGSAVSSSVVPHKGEIGELYVDVTDAPTEIIGSSRYRVRRRAARLEAFAADLEKGGQTDQASAVRLKAQSLRSSLGEDSGTVSLSHLKQKPTKWWIVALLAVLIGLFAGWVMRGDGSDPAATLINSTTTLVQESSTSVAVVQPSDQSLIAYRPGATRFFGEGNVNLAAEIESVGEDSAAVRVQIYDQYERSLGQSTPSTEQSLMQTCEVRIGTDTGSGGGSYAIQTRIAAYTAGSYEDAQLLLTETDLGEPDAEYAGPVAMTANIIESCEVRRVIDQDAVIEIARSAFEAFTLDIPLNANETFVVLRIINERGSSVSWTSTDVLKIEK
jgi:hypothetical protein